MLWEIIKWIIIIGVFAPVVIALGLWAYKRVVKGKDKVDHYRQSRKK